MSQRDSGYARKERDCYETPEWVTLALDPYMDKPLTIWEPACGSGKMVRALERMGHKVVASDIDTGADFFQYDCLMNDADAIVTNPPYDQAEEFIQHALRLTDRNRGFVAMLLRTDFDHAKTRKHLFSYNSSFARKIVLTKRIRWIEGSTGSPSFNHAWFTWWHRHKGPPTLAYE